MRTQYAHRYTVILVAAALQSRSCHFQWRNYRGRWGGEYMGVRYILYTNIMQFFSSILENFPKFEKTPTFVVAMDSKIHFYQQQQIFSPFIRTETVNIINMFLFFQLLDHLTTIQYLYMYFICQYTYVCSICSGNYENS